MWGENAQQKLPDWQDGESVKLVVGSRQTKLNLLWVVGRVLREVADLAVEVGELLQVGRLLEEWEGDPPN